MKKIQFSARGPLKIFKKILNLFIGLCISSITLALCFVILEAFFHYYYTSEKGIPQTAMNLPIYQNSEYRSWEHKPNARAEHGFGTPTPIIQINSIGLRNEEVADEKNRKRYLLLGDSFTFGMGVNASDTFAVKLQKMLGNRYHNVINAGVIGQTIDDAFLYLKNDGIKLQPDFVIYNFFVGNDITELRRHIWEQSPDGGITKVTDKVLHADEKNRLRQREEKEPESYFLFWLQQKIDILKNKYGYASDTIDPTLTWPVFLSDNHPSQDANLDDYWYSFETVLRQMNEYCKSQNVPLIINMIPMDTQINKSYWKKYPGTPFGEEEFEAKRPQKRMLFLGQKYGIPVLDLLPVLQNTEEQNNMSLYFDNDPHFNALGHRYTAAALWQYLMDHYLK